MKWEMGTGKWFVGDLALGTGHGLQGQVILRRITGIIQVRLHIAAERGHSSNIHILQNSKQDTFYIMWTKT